MVESSSDPFFDRYVRRKKQLTSDFAKEVLPIQKAVIEKLAVDTIENKVGVKLAAAINEGLQKNTHLNSPETEELAKLLRAQDTKYSVQEITVQEDNTEVTRYLVRKLPLTETTSTLEIFTLPKPNRLRKVWPARFLKYKHYLVIDTSTGKTADLLDTTYENVPSHTVIRPYFYQKMMSGYYSASKGSKSRDIYMLNSHRQNLESKNADMNKLPQINESSITYTHEAGHTAQTNYFGDPHMSLYKSFAQETLANLKSMAVTMSWRGHEKTFIDETVNSIVTERNAWAFALQVIRKYRKLGLDIAPLVSDKELIEIINAHLSRYIGRISYYGEADVTKLKKYRNSPVINKN